MNNNYYYNKHLAYPKLVVDGESYLDFSSLQDLLEIPKSNLFRAIKSLTNVRTLRYKNRTYYHVDFCLNYHKIISEQNRK